MKKKAHLQIVYIESEIRLRIVEPCQYKIIKVTSYHVPPLVALASRFVWNSYPQTRHEIVEAMDKSLEALITVLERQCRFSAIMKESRD